MDRAQTVAADELKSAWLLLELEAQLVTLAAAFADAGLESVLSNGPAIRPALKYGFATSGAAELLVEHGQLAGARTVLAEDGWIRPPDGLRVGDDHWRQGMTVRLVGARALPGETAIGRYGFPEPADHVSARFPDPEDGPPASSPSTAAEDERRASLRVRVDAAFGRATSDDFIGTSIERGPGVFRVEPMTENYAAYTLQRMGNWFDPNVVEVGTGAGAVALTIALGRAEAKVIGIDTSARAIAWARRNARRLGVGNVEFRCGSLLDPVPPEWRRSVQVVLANLPCVPPRVGAELRSPGRCPPGTATGPGPDGLGLVRTVVTQAPEVLCDGGLLVLQLPGFQAATMAPVLTATGFDVEIPADPEQYGTVVISGRLRSS